MSHTENDLVTMLRERAAGEPANPRRAEQTAARGKRLLRRRRGTRTALTGGAMAVIAGAVLLQTGGTNNTMPADAVPVSVRLPVEVPLPGQADHMLGDEKVPLIESQQHEEIGKPVQLRFTALSTDTMYAVRCSDPDAWVVIVTDSPARSASVGRCGRDQLGQFDARSAGSQWVGRTHGWQVWVLPAAAKIDRDLIDGNLDPYNDGVLKRIAAEAGGTSTGAWAIGIYDRRR